MTHDEFMDLDPQAAADKLNALMAEGKSQDEAAAEFELTKPDLLKLNVFFVKDKYIARAWGGYTSTRRLPATRVLASLASAAASRTSSR